MNLLDQYSHLHEFIQERIREDIYPEPPSPLHQQISAQMIDRLNQLVPLADKKILDCGCGQGVALEIFKKLGGKPIGTTFGEDLEVCKRNGFEVYAMDQSFLEFPQESFDVIWCRHALEHSLFPLYTLRRFYETLKKDGILYVEVPAPDTSARHETNRNHYSCFTKNAWVSLFTRSKFQIFDQLDLTFKIMVGDDTYHAFFLRKIA
jgi:SAM-dependent methyltransferase